MRWLVALHPLLYASVSAPPTKPAGGLPMLESQMSCGLCNAEQTGIRAPKLVCQFASPWVGGWGECTYRPSRFGQRAIIWAFGIFFHSPDTAQVTCGLAAILLFSIYPPLCLQHRSYLPLPACRIKSQRLGRAFILCNLSPT